MTQSKEHIEITQRSKSNFQYSVYLLPKDKSDAMNTIYAFCRTTDDIADNETDTKDIKFKKLREWRDEFEKALQGKSSYTLLNHLNNIIKKYNIPLEPFFELIKGIEQDLQTSRYRDFESLYQYCYRVAVTVGLMSIEIFGNKTKSAKEYAVNLGIALQLTNILRDVKYDALNGRIYIPEEDLTRFGYSQDDLINFKYNSSFIELMEFECKRAREYFEKANNCFTDVDRKMLFPARIMHKVYFDILKKIEHLNYNVFRKKIKVSKLKQLYYTIGVFLKYRLAYR